LAEADAALGGVEMMLTNTSRHRSFIDDGNEYVGVALILDAYDVIDRPVAGPGAYIISL